MWAAVQRDAALMMKAEKRLLFHIIKPGLACVQPCYIVDDCFYKPTVLDPQIFYKSR